MVGLLSVCLRHFPLAGMGLIDYLGKPIWDERSSLELSAVEKLCSYSNRP